MDNKLSCIMVIDDDEPTNFISTMLIEEAGCTHHLEIADSGMKALNYLKKATEEVGSKGDFIPPDLVFLDINMPRMNGWEFLTEFRKISNGHALKPVIIMLTTSLNPDDKQRAENIPEIADFENKPLTKEMIERIIRKYFKAA
ncbi:response regulator [Ferruginibacter sp.]|jgi:CheY-like chemotaxis protein|uniref:response regulator n=1 Tax=Ferruginibacter sp. TaxID=1940288 RepID=UPI0026582B58|nr:response regulator [Ferruginibacter sp.]